MKDYAVEDLNNTLDEEILRNYQEQMKSAFNKYNELCKKKNDYIKNAKDIKNKYITFRLLNFDYVGKIIGYDTWNENEGFYYCCKCFGLTEPYFHNAFTISEKSVTYITEKQYNQLIKKGLKLIADAT